MFFLCKTANMLMNTTGRVSNILKLRVAVMPLPSDSSHVPTVLSPFTYPRKGGGVGIQEWVLVAPPAVAPVPAMLLTNTPKQRHFLSHFFFTFLKFYFHSDIQETNKCCWCVREPRCKEIALGIVLHPLSVHSSTLLFFSAVIISTSVCCWF